MGMVAPGIYRPCSEVRRSRLPPGSLTATKRLIGTLSLHDTIASATANPHAACRGEEVRGYYDEMRGLATAKAKVRSRKRAHRADTMARVVRRRAARHSLARRRGLARCLRPVLRTTTHDNRPKFRRGRFIAQAKDLDMCDTFKKPWCIEGGDALGTGAVGCEVKS